MSFLYIVSFRQMVAENKYKFGMYAGTREQLISRYITPMPDPIIYYYREVLNNYEIEQSVLSKLDKHRVINNRGNKSEWIQMSLHEIIDTIEDIIRKYNDTTSKNDRSKHIERVDNQMYKFKHSGRTFFVCMRCNKVFYDKCKYENHIIRKNQCQINDIDTTLQIEIFLCEYCSTVCCRKDKLKNHIKNIHRIKNPIIKPVFKVINKNELLQYDEKIKDYKKMILFVINSHSNFINISDYDYLLSKLENSHDDKLLEIIFNLVIQCIYLHEKPTDEILKNKINSGDAINEFIKKNNS